MGRHKTPSRKGTSWNKRVWRSLESGIRGWTPYSNKTRRSVKLGKKRRAQWEIGEKRRNPRERYTEPRQQGFKSKRRRQHMLENERELQRRWRGKTSPERQEGIQKNSTWVRQPIRPAKIMKAAPSATQSPRSSTIVWSVKRAINFMYSNIKLGAEGVPDLWNRNGAKINPNTIALVVMYFALLELVRGSSNTNMMQDSCGWSFQLNEIYTLFENIDVTCTQKWCTARMLPNASGGVYFKLIWCCLLKCYTLHWTISNSKILYVSLNNIRF